MSVRAPQLDVNESLSAALIRTSEEQRGSKLQEEEEEEGGGF